MNKRDEGVRVAHPLFQAEGGGSTPASSLSIRGTSSERVRDRSGKRTGTDRLYRWNINGDEADASAKVRWEIEL